MSEENKKFSQLDFGGVLRSAHEDKNKSLRVTSANTSVPASYSRVVLTYNASDSVTNATFFEGTLAEVRQVEFISDIGGSLNNDYFTLQSENNESLYHVWYNVSGGGVDPTPAGSVGIEIPIATNDAASIVALATKLCLEQFIDEFKIVNQSSAVLNIENARKGLATNSVDVGTGFTLTTIQEGEEKLVKSIDVPFDDKAKYIFNVEEKKFEVFPVADLNVTLTGEIDIKEPNTLSIISKTIVTKNIEVTQVLPDDTKSYRITVQDYKAKLLLAHTAGETATNFKTIARGGSWESGNIDIADGTTIYLLSSQDGIVVEIEIWRRL